MTDNMDTINDLINDIEEEDRIKDQEIARKRKANIKRKQIERKRFRTSIEAITIAAFVAVAGIGAYEINKVISERNKFEQQVNNINKLGNGVIPSYMKTIVDNSIHNRQDQYNTYVNYDEIGNGINQCRDKDLALYVLYVNYGKREGIPEYNNIFEKTLYYVEKENGQHYKGINDYLESKGYDNLNEYYDIEGAILENKYKSNKSDIVLSPYKQQEGGKTNERQ